MVFMKTSYHRPFPFSCLGRPASTIWWKSLRNVKLKLSVYPFRWKIIYPKELGWYCEGKSFGHSWERKS